MRWFKHLTATADDDRIADYLDRCERGHLEGYGFWWRTLEVIAAAMDGGDQCSVTKSLSQWSRVYGIHHHKVTKYLSLLHDAGLACVDYPDTTQRLPNGYPTVTQRLPPPASGGVTSGSAQSKIRVTVPNLLKYRDEYSRKSGQRQESVRPRTDTDTDTDTEREKDPGPASAEPPLKASPRETNPKRGTRLPEDWTLPADWRQWAVEFRRDVDPDREADKFRDYWIAKPGKDGCKLDWLATWRNWIRRANGTPRLRAVVGSDAATAGREWS